MITTLFTFLGRVAQNESSYKPTQYRFEDGSQSHRISFFAWALQKRIRADRIVILGTSGSMWDHIFEGDIPIEGFEAERLLLMDAAKAKAVTPELLAPLERSISERAECEIRLALMPYCRDEHEQIEVLRIMAEYVRPGDGVHIDVSHGFRHLPMLALLSALHLKTARRAKIRGIWYGAFDPDTSKGSVHDLSGLLQIASWIEALHTYDKDSDYGAFAQLLGGAGDLLAEAAFFERTTNPVKARERLYSWSRRDDRFPSGDPAADLFRRELERRIHWIQKEDRCGWERDLARRYLQEADYLRAAIYCLEGVVSNEARKAGRDWDDGDQRVTTYNELKKSGSADFRRLRKIRNSLAHGGQPREDVEGILGNETHLRRDLDRLLTILLPTDKQQAAVKNANSL